MTSMIAELNLTATSRPRPGPGFPVAPPAPEQAYATWAAVLAEPLTTGQFHWVMNEDGALVPVAVSDEDAMRPTSRRTFGARLAMLLGR
jgi:hypothetical protein